MEGQTDMTKLRVASRNFSNARKNIHHIFISRAIQICELLRPDVIVSCFMDSLEIPKDLISSSLTEAH